MEILFSAANTATATKQTRIIVMRRSAVVYVYSEHQIVSQGRS